MDAHDYCTDLPFVDWYKTVQDEGHSTYFKNDRFLNLMIVSFDNAAVHKYVVQNATSLWIARSEKIGHSFLVLIKKWHKLFWNFQLQAFNSANSSWASQVCGLLEFALSVICVSKFSWIPKPKELLKLCMKLLTLV